MTLQILLPFLEPPQTSLSIPQTLLSAPPTHLPLLPIFCTIFLVSYTYHVSCTPLFQQLLLSLYLTSFPKPFTSCPVYIFSLYSASPPPISFFLWPNSCPLYPTSYCMCYLSLNPIALPPSTCLSFPISSPHCPVHSPYSLPHRCRPTSK